MPRNRSSSSSDRSPVRKRSRSHERTSHKRRDRSRSRSMERKYDKKRRSPSPNRKRRSPDRRRRSPSPDRRHRSRTPERNRRREIKREPDSPARDNREHRRSYDRERDGQSSGFSKQNKPKDEKWGRPEMHEKKEDVKPDEEKEKPSFEPSGKLAADTNTFRGVGDEALPAIYIHRQSAYLVGRDRKIADFPVDHPSCSKQHAAFQYRSVLYDRADGSRGRKTKPYIIDLGSANGTYLNGERINPQRYYELKEKDVIKFGFSSREFVVLHENSLDKAEGTPPEEEEDSEDDDDESDKVKKEAPVGDEEEYGYKH